MPVFDVPNAMRGISSPAFCSIGICAITLRIFASIAAFAYMGFLTIGQYFGWQYSGLARTQRPPHLPRRAIPTCKEPVQ